MATPKKRGSAKPTNRRSSPVLDVSKNKSINVRQIENGFVISESGTTGSGRNAKYFNREYFSSTEPKFNLTKQASSTKRK